jgi:3-deoxy-D-manno-octulosonic-acid transferase
LAAAAGLTRALFGAQGAGYAAPHPRPETGQLVWAHASSADRLSALQDIALRLKQGRARMHVLITVDRLPDGPPPESGGADWVVPLGPGTPAHVRGFFDHWRPDLAVWTGGQISPQHLDTAARRAVPLVLVDADEAGLDQPRRQWFAPRKALRGAARVMVTGKPAKALAERLGAPADRIEISGRLHSAGTVLPGSDRDLADAAGMVGTRPLWLAAHVQKGEIDAVLRAHRQVIRLAHRMLLVLIPSSDTDRVAVHGALARHDLRCADWDNGEIAQEMTQVLLTTEARSLGIWLRIAPLTFMGSSLVAGHGGRTPFHAAALGSAVLYGPNIRDHLDAYSRLAAAGAARIVKDGQSLGDAVTRLAAPEQAASMALAGWEVVSEGAHVTDQLLAHMNDLLDEAIR